LLALGGRLVEQFKLREDEDTLGQWIAHHIAEKLTACKTAAGTAKASLEIELVDTILKFWKHRAFFPRGTRPFEGYDAVLRALESFDPTPDNGRYFWYDGANELAKSAKPPSQAWIDAAKAFDRGARTIVSFCFRQAARASEQPDEVWLSAGKVLAEDADRDFRVIRLIRAGGQDDTKTDPSAIETEQLRKKRDDLLRLIRSGVVLLELIDNHLDTPKTEAADPKRSQSESKPLSKSKSTGPTKRKSKQSPGRANPKSSRNAAPTRKKSNR
jgi:hypothetical protein